MSRNPSEVLTGPHADPENALHEMMTDKDGPGHVLSAAILLLPLLLLPSFIHPHFVLFDPPPPNA